jgi:hypothetical protein
LLYSSTGFEIAKFASLCSEILAQRSRAFQELGSVQLVLVPVDRFYCMLVGKAKWQPYGRLRVSFTCVSNGTTPLGCLALLKAMLQLGSRKLECRRNGEDRGMLTPYFAVAYPARLLDVVRLSRRPPPSAKAIRY